MRLSVVRVEAEQYDVTAGEPEPVYVFGETWVILRAGKTQISISRWDGAGYGPTPRVGDVYDLTLTPEVAR